MLKKLGQWFCRHEFIWRNDYHRHIFLECRKCFLTTPGIFLYTGAYEDWT